MQLGKLNGQHRENNTLPFPSTPSGIAGSHRSSRLRTNVPNFPNISLRVHLDWVMPAHGLAVKGRASAQDWASPACRSMWVFVPWTSRGCQGGNNLNALIDAHLCARLNLGRAQAKQLGLGVAIKQIFGEPTSISGSLVARWHDAVKPKRFGQSNTSNSTGQQIWKSWTMSLGMSVNGHWAPAPPPPCCAPLRIGPRTTPNNGCFMLRVVAGSFQAG